MPRLIKLHFISFKVSLGFFLTMYYRIRLLKVMLSILLSFRITCKNLNLLH